MSLINPRGYPVTPDGEADIIDANNQVMSAISVDVDGIDTRVTDLEGATGASGSFTTADLKTVTVVDGRITSIV